MPTKIIAIAFNGGGSGKTTITTNVGLEMAARGLDVIIIDLDPQASQTIALGHHASDDPLSDPLVEISLETALLRRERKTAGRLRLLRAGRSLLDASLTELEGQLDRVPATADIVLIDTEPRLATSSRLAMSVADLVLAPLRASPKALSPFTDTMEAARIKAPNAKFRAAFNLVNSSRPKVVAAVEQQIRSMAPGVLLTTRIPDDARCERDILENIPVRRYGSRSPAARALAELTSALLSELAVAPHSKAHDAGASVGGDRDAA